MQPNPRSLAALLFAGITLALPLSATAGPVTLPVLPGLHNDGRYAFVEPGKVSEVQVSFTSALKIATPTAPQEFVQIEGVANMAELTAKLQALEAATKRTFAPLLKIDGRNATLSRTVLASIPSTTVNLTTLAKQVGATKASRLDFDRDSVVVVFSGITQALQGAEALAKIPGVVFARPAMAYHDIAPQFVPNDYYYAYRAGAAGYCWHLKNTETPGLDVNAEPAWDVTKGEQVKVAVLDDGLEITHEDLKPNIFVGGSFDFVDGDGDPTAGEHGTSVAGLIGAKGNNKVGTGFGMVGGAMNCQMFGLRILGGNNVTEVDISRALGWNNSFHVSNNSWGYTRPYLRFDVLDNAIKSTTKQGRSGRGTVFMMSSGNGRGDGHDSNLMAMHNLIENNSIAAINSLGIYCSYSTPSAGILCAAPSGELLTDPFRMITSTDRTADLGYNPLYKPAVPGFNYPNTKYTNTFNGTSASCPIASGVVGLIIAARPAVSWRDVQDIIMRTSKPIGAGGDFQVKLIEGQTFAVSHNVGSGMIDAGAAVARAKTATLLTSAVSGTYSLGNAAIDIPDGPDGVIEIPILVANAPRLKLEKTLFTLEVQHPRPSSLRVTLVSPRGTVSLLQPSRPKFNRPNVWTYVSTQNWAECSGGDWKVVVKDPVAGDVGQVIGGKLQIFGPVGKQPTVLPEITNGNIMPPGFQLCRRYAAPNEYHITATGCPLSYDAIGLPKGMAVSVISGRIFGIPTEAGTFTVTLIAKVEVGQATKNVTLTVNPQVPMPYMTGGFSGIGTVGERFNLQVFTNPTIIRYVFSGLPEGMDTSKPGPLDSGLITGVPTSEGFYHVRCQVSNYCGSDTHSIYIYIRKPENSLAAALDVPGTVFQGYFNNTDTWHWSNGGDGYDGDTARSPIIKVGEKVNFSTSISGPVDLAFDWTSSNAEADITTFKVLGKGATPDPGIMDQIGGITPWIHFPRTSALQHLGAGDFTLVWEYENNTAVLGGDEHSRIDHLVLLYPELAVALDIPPPGTVSSFGANRWYRKTIGSSDSVDHAQSGPIPDSSSSTMEISVTGPGTLQWKWRVSSLEGDVLGVSLDGGANLLEISGNVAPASDWTPANITIPAGEHLVRWTYKKDDIPRNPTTDPVVQDAGFVDVVTFVATP